MVFPKAVRISSTPTPLKIWFSPRSPAVYDIKIVLYGGELACLKLIKFDIYI